MKDKREYVLLVKDSKNIFEYLEDLKKENSPINVLIKIREIFPEISFLEAKESLIISYGDHDNIEDYQEQLFKDITEEDLI